jgi:metal-responsive CopG/Arc/MetJ family transcriptional regulator
MNVTSNYVRMNISLPTDLAKELRKRIATRGISKFMSDAAKEKIEKEERERAFKELLEGPPAFTEIKDSVAYVRKMRRLDEKRLKRLGI